MSPKNINWDKVNPNSIPINVISDNDFVKELASKDLESEIKLPFVMKDKILMSPGTWNGHVFTREEIRQAFKRTDFTDKENISLFLDHRDKESGEWAGFVRNIRLKSDGTVIGDLEILDKPIAIKLAAGAKMGISAKVLGGIGEDKKMMNFRFANFSVVINPAVKTAFINNSEGGDVEEVHGALEPQIVEVDQEEELHNDPPSENDNQSNDKKIQSEVEDMTEDMIENADMQGKKKPEQPIEEDVPSGKKFSPTPEHNFQLSQKEVKNLMTNPKFAEFAQDYVKENPEADIKELSDAYGEFKYMESIRSVVRDEIKAALGSTASLENQEEEDEAPAEEPAPEEEVEDEPAEEEPEAEAELSEGESVTVKTEDSGQVELSVEEADGIMWKNMMNKQGYAALGESHAEVK